MIIQKRVVRNRVVTMALVTSFCLFMIGSVGCTKYAGPEDLKNLEEARQAAVSAEKELDRLKSDRREIEKEIAAQQEVLREAERELENAKNR